MSRRIAWTTLSILLVTLVAGCTAPAPTGGHPMEADPPAHAASDPLLERLHLDVAAQDADPASSPSVDDLLRMEAASSPDGRLTAFRWVVPAGALVEDEGGSASLYLEAAPLLAKDRAWPEQWGLMVFAERPEGLVHVGSLLVPTYTLERVESGQIVERTVHEPEARPFVLEVGRTATAASSPLGAGAAVQEGDVLYLVLGVRGEDGGLPFVLRVLQEGSPSGSEGDPRSLAQAMQDTPPVGLSPVAEGTGFHVLAYQESSRMAETYVQGRRAYTDGFFLRETDHLGPLGFLKDRTLEIRMEVLPWEYKGWGITAYASQGITHSGNWTLQAEAFGQSFADQGLIYASDAQQQGAAATGETTVYLVGDGLGSQSTYLRMRSAHASQQESLVLFQATLGTPLLELLGTAGVEETAGAASVAGLGWGIVFG